MREIRFNQSLGRMIFSLSVFVLVCLISPVVTRAYQVTDRSIHLSSSSASAKEVTYTVNFTTVGSAGAFVVEFCSNTPLTGQLCVAPDNLDSSLASSTTAGFTDVSGSVNKIVVAGIMDNEDEVSVEIEGIKNPSSAGTIYARVVTYDTKANALNYTSTDIGEGSIDEGGMAIAITPTIGVSGTVLESLTFCISGSVISANCESTTAPVLELGEQVGDDAVLTAGVLSEGMVHIQISTNAVNGAVVRIKSNTTGCGGLSRSGAPSACDILPALDLGLNVNNADARFGVKTAEATDTPSVNASGILQPAIGSIYNNDTYALNFVTGDAIGITSAFGDPLLDTNNAPVNNKNMALTFGVTIGNSTPAGLYSADIGLIATGKF